MIYLKLFFEFFRIGLFTFGGGYAMIPLIKESVLTNGWLSENAFYDFIGVCESTPGPIAVNMATYVGAHTCGFFGSVCATFGVVLPSFIIIILVATILKKLMKNTYFNAFLNGLKPVILGLILSTGIVLLFKLVGYQTVTKWSFDYKALITFSIIVIGYILTKKIIKKNISAILIIVISGLLGLLISMI